MSCSGDFDSICSLTATRYSVKDLNLAVTKKWGPWYTPNGEVNHCYSLTDRERETCVFRFVCDFEDLDLGVGTGCWMQVGGYVQQYQGGFTLASVRAAGHMVPTFQPERSLVLLKAFLSNTLPPADIVTN